MLWGWALIILAYDDLNLGERFRQLYDYLWFPTALAAVFFVADSGSNTTLESVKEHGKVMRAQAGFLLAQVEHYDACCNRMALQKNCHVSGLATFITPFIA